MNNSPMSMNKRWFLFFTWTFASLLLLIKPTADLVRLSLSQDDASYLILIPIISAAVIYLERRRIFLQVSTERMFAGFFLLLGGFFALVSYLAKNPFPSLQLSGWIITLVLFWVAGFALFLGKDALRAASFPLLFLFLMAPIPEPLLGRVISLLQQGSAWITGGLFDLVGVPALREGLVFHLASVNIEIAKECSGIRSSIALLILALLVAHFRLRRFPNKVLFVMFGLFLMILKNGVRIATLTLLAMYVDPGFLFGRLHRQGGIVFFVLAVFLLVPLLLFLQRREAQAALVLPVS